jgi:hypothetical protein
VESCRPLLADTVCAVCFRIAPNMQLMRNAQMCCSSPTVHVFILCAPCACACGLRGCMLRYACVEHIHTVTWAGSAACT